MDPGRTPATDYGAFVVRTLAKMTKVSKTMDQSVLRQCIGLSPSYLLTDSSMNHEQGVNTWRTGFNCLVEVLVALHARDELEIETVNEASRACSECWSIAGSWKGLDESREGVRAVATKLKRLLDENGRTYKGERVIPGAVRNTHDDES